MSIVASHAARQPTKITYRDGIAIETLRDLLVHDASSGLLTWKLRGIEWFRDGVRYSAATNQKRWNTQNAGRLAFNTKQDGGLFGWILKRPFFAHRVIWAMETGAWPDGFIDHISGDPFDNRFVNLRLSDPSSNQRNKRLLDANTSGFCGVRAVKSRFQARAHMMGKDIHIGSFRTFDEAVSARKNFNACNGFSERHGTPIKDGA